MLLFLSMRAHMSRMPFLLAIAVAGLCACATTEPPVQTAAAAPPAVTAAKAKKAVPKKICENEMPLGSHIATVHCRNADQADQDRAATQTELLRARSTPALPGN
jgi:hypothetical protein